MSEMWNQRYAQDGWAYGTDPNDFIAENHGAIESSPVLVLAAGEGRNAVFLAEQGFDVTAVDASEVGLEKAEKLAAERGVEITTEVADLAHWGLGDEQWGGITSVFCHLEPDVRERLHRDVVRALKPGGVFLLEAYTPEQLGHGTGGPPVVDLMMTLKDLRSELEGLEFEHSEELEREISEGRYHQGTSHVVQLIARKPA